MLLVLTPIAAGAQQGTVHLEEIRIPAWVNSRSLLGINMLLGGISAGVVGELRGGSFKLAFAQGTAGGLVVFLGKTVAAQQFDGAGLLGRQVAATGGAIVQNAAAGLRPLDRLAFPIGPAQVLLDTRETRVRLRVDPVSVAVIGVGAVHPDMHFDTYASLGAGVPVFRSREGMLVAPWSGRESCGLEVASVLFFGRLDAFDAATRRTVRAHERLHTLQADAFQAYWGRPLLEWVLPESPGWLKARPFLDINLGDAITELTDALLFSAYATRPWEIEAEALALRRR